MKMTLSRLIGSKLFAAFGLVLLSATAWAGQGAMTIENERYTVNIEATDGTFTIATKPSGKIVLPAGKLSGTAGTAKSVELDDKNFGKGKGVEVTYADGNRELVALYPNLPFVTFRSTLRNSGTEPVVHKHVATVSAAVDLGKSMESIQTLGTGGLFPPDKNPGSYPFLSIVDLHEVEAKGLQFLGAGCNQFRQMNLITSGSVAIHIPCAQAGHLLR